MCVKPNDNTSFFSPVFKINEASSHNKMVIAIISKLFLISLISKVKNAKKRATKKVQKHFSVEIASLGV